MLQKITKLLIILLTGTVVNIFGAGKVFAGTYISGHVFVTYQGAKVYLKAADLEWRITEGGSGYRTVKSGDIYSYANSNRLDCTTQKMGYGNPNPACITNEQGSTIDDYNNVNYVFPRIGGFGCSRQRATLKPSLPDNNQVLPGGLSSVAGEWTLASAESFNGATEFYWDKVLQMLTIKDLNDADEYVNVDFEWIPSGPTPTPTPTPTPEPPASCACYLLTSDHPNLTAVKRGETLNFMAEAYVDTPETAKVKEMGFYLYQVDPESLEKIAEIANSRLIACDGVAQPDGSVCDFKSSDIIGGADVYEAQWTYMIKDTDPLGLYRLELTINCAWKEAYGGSRVLGEARDYYL